MFFLFFCFFVFVFCFVFLQLCVLLTDGKQTGRSIDPSINSQKLKDKGITVFAFGFGSERDVDERQLEKIATSKDHAGRSEDMNILIDMVIDMTRKECPGRCM